MTQTYEQVDPTTIALGDNVRLDPRLDKEFLASVRERGMLEPVLLYRGSDGTLTVLAGQRRTLAAQQAGRPTIPAVVDDTPPADADRLVDQYVENEHRAPLSNSERIGAIEQMSLAGLSEHQIAKRTATPKAVVRAAKAAAQAPALREFADQLTLDQAATPCRATGEELPTRTVCGGSESAATATARHARTRFGFYLLSSYRILMSRNSHRFAVSNVQIWGAPPSFIAI